MAKVNWTEEAVRWLQEIRDYIAQDNPNAAFRVVREFTTRSSRSGSFLKSGIFTQQGAITMCVSCCMVITESRT